ncbi:MAG: MFS transporter [Promethearchaeota archaeon]
MVKKRELASLPHYKRRYHGLRPIASISILMFTVAAFYAVEQQFLNSYIIQVLNLPAYRVALMVNFSAIVSFIVTIFLGAWSDSLPESRVGRRRPFALGGSLAGLAVIFVPFVEKYWLVFFIDVVFISFLGNLSQTAQKTIIPDMYPKEARGSRNAVFSFAELIGGMSVFILGVVALIYFPIETADFHGRTYYFGALPYHRLVIITIGIVMIIGNLLFFGTIKEPKLGIPPAPFWKSIKSIFSVKEMRKHKDFLKFLGVLVIIQAGMYIYTPYTTVFISSSETNATFATILGASFFGGLLIGIPLFGYLLNRFPRKPVTIFGVVLSGAGFVLVSLFGNLESFTTANIIITSISFTLASAASTGLNISFRTWSQDLLPEGERAKFIGILNLAFSISQIPGSYLGAWIVETWGVRWVFLGGAIIYLIFGQLFWIVKETYSPGKKGALDTTLLGENS